MAGLHDVLARLFNWLLAPVAGLPPLLGVALIAAAFGVVLLPVFRATSNPAAIRGARQLTQAHLLAVRLYRDDLGVVFRAQAAFLHALGAYLGRMLLPSLVVLLPAALLFGQLEARYASWALHPGERAVLTAVLAPAMPQAADGWRLEGSAGVAVDSRPLRIPARREIDWRIRAVSPGRYAVALVDGTRRVEKLVQVSATQRGAAPERDAAGIAALFVAPSEAPIDPRSGVERAAVGYPPLRLSVLGWHLHWLVVFLAVSFAAALALRKPFGVEF